MFVSVWSEGIVKTSCTLNETTGELTPETCDVKENLGCLEREYFETQDENEIPVCPTCHEFIMTLVMNPALSDKHTILEDHQCSNPDCDSRE